MCKEIVSCDYLSEKIFDICIGYASDIYFISIKFIQKKKNRVERLNDKNLKTCTKEEKFAETKICYVIIYPEKYLFN